MEVSDRFTAEKRNTDGEMNALIRNRDVDSPQRMRISSPMT
jgi:hypothetical protein